MRSIRAAVGSALVAAAFTGITWGTPAADPKNPKEAAKRTSPNGVAIPDGASVRAYHVC